MHAKIPEYLNQFIINEKFNDWFNTDMPIFHCEFRREYYSDQLFNQLEIPFSSSLINAVVKRRAEFLAGRYCAVKSLQKLNIYNVSIETGIHRNPLWPANIKGSISHSDNCAVAITTDQRNILGVGIDIENIVALDTLEAIQHQILSNTEIELISHIHHKKELAFSLAFSLKESFFKAAYPTIKEYFDFDAVTITDINWNDKTILFSINKTLHPTFTQHMTLTGKFQLLPQERVVTLVVV